MWVGESPINLFTHPNSEPKNPLDGVNFFSASAINCNAFCSLSAIVTQLLQSLANSINKISHKSQNYGQSLCVFLFFFTFAHCLILQNKNSLLQVRRLFCVVEENSSIDKKCSRARLPNRSTYARTHSRLHVST